MTLTEIQSQVTKTAAFGGVWLDTSGVKYGDGSVADWTLKINVSALADGNSARFQFDDSVNGGTANIAGPTFSIKGKIEASYDKVRSFKKQDFPDLRLGQATSAIRLQLTDIQGTSPSVTYRAWIEY
jgi:hypothetical protein